MFRSEKNSIVRVLEDEAGRKSAGINTQCACLYGGLFYPFEV